LTITKLTGASSSSAFRTPGAMLEPAMFAAYTVNSLGDTGAGSGTTGDLRYCMTQANLAGGSNTITFSVTVRSRWRARCQRSATTSPSMGPAPAC
jgi:hypothetical protein